MTSGPSRDDLRYLHVCGTCYRLFESDRPDGRNQQCACTPMTGERWPRYDFNERARLCGCCATEALDSGSRFSAFFCRECQLLAMGATLWERRLVIPIGRHSLMHTYVPRAREPWPGHVGTQSVETVHATLTSVGARSALMQQWSDRSVARHLHHAGLPGGVRLTDYLDAVKERGTGTTRWAMFAEFCEFIRDPATCTVN